MPRYGAESPPRCGGGGELTSPGHAHLPLCHVAADPNHAIAAHDGVHWVWLTQERLSIRGQDASAGEGIPAVAPVRMAVDHPYRLPPPRLLATLLRDHVAAARLGRIHVGGRYARDHYRGAAYFAQHAAEELRGIRL